MTAALFGASATAIESLSSDENANTAIIRLSLSNADGECNGASTIEVRPLAQPTADQTEGGSGGAGPARNYAACWREGRAGAAAIAAATLAGLVKARYSAAYSGGRISTIDSFSTHTSIT